MRDFPRVDDYLVEPESGQEVVRGVWMEVAGSSPPHAERQHKLAYVIEPNVAPGYVAATELLTRVSWGSNFATDLCVRHEGIDPETGVRYLEELAFEIVAEQSRRQITIRAEDLAARGVRRIIAIFVKKNQIAEWSAAEGCFVTLPLDEMFEDPTLRQPIPVQALLDAAVADDVVAAALHAKGNPWLLQREAESREEGREEGLAQALLAMLAKLGLVPTVEQRATIESCHDADRLQRWLLGSVDTDSVADLLELE